MYRGGRRVYVLLRIRRKKHRDIDGRLGTSVLRFDGIALCIAKPLESSVVDAATNQSLLERFIWKMIGKPEQCSTKKFIKLLTINSQQFTINN